MNCIFYFALGAVPSQIYGEENHDLPELQNRERHA